jgi:hypothetical protein
MIKSLLWFIKAIFLAITKDLIPSLIALCKAFVAFLEWIFGKKNKDGQPFTLSSCVPIGHPAFKRPDPLIYDQYYLMSLGLAVTWQNPDIEILQGGVPVASTFELQPATTYTVRARIWNGSTQGVCGGMPVTFSYLSFGVGTQSHLIGQTAVNLGVKGSASCPAYASTDWTTPAVPGHYCVQVSFVWPDDLNPFNNLGQENTQVVPALSPGIFSFALRNADSEQKTYRFEADTYTIGALPLCTDSPAAGNSGGQRGVSSLIKSRNSRAKNPLPAGWTIAFNPPAPVLTPGEQIEVQVTVTPPNSFHGEQPINIHTFSGSSLIGGVTISLQRH